MNLAQLLANIKDIKASAPPPYYVGRRLKKELDDACAGATSTIDGNGVETCTYQGIAGLETVPFTILEYPVEKGPDGKILPNDMDWLLGVAGPDKIFNEIKVE